MMKVVINSCFGGFVLSAKARERYDELTGIKHTDRYFYTIKRYDNYLVQVVEELGDEANGKYATLKVVEVEPGRRYRIALFEYGVEEVQYLSDDPECRTYELELHDDWKLAY